MLLPFLFLIERSNLWYNLQKKYTSERLCSPALLWSKSLIAFTSQGKAIFLQAPQKKMVIASGTTCEFKERYIIWVFMWNFFDNERCFLALWQSLRSKRNVVRVHSVPSSQLCENLSLCSATICNYVDTHASFEFFDFSFCCSVSSTCFGFVALLFLWRCVAFVFCMPSSSDLLWPPSAREHSADPSGKVCTLDCNPSPVSSCSPVPESPGLHNSHTTYLSLECPWLVVQPCDSHPAILSTLQPPN